jgi:hypothetical protein
MANHIEDVVSLFRQSLGQGLGDLETMLSGLRRRIEHPGEQPDPNFPPSGYRSQLLRDRLRKEYGARRTTLWGATALRGRFKPEKDHIIHFLEAVNSLAEQDLPQAFDECARLYARKVNQEAAQIALPKTSLAQQQLIQVARTPSGGRVQQGLVYSLLQVKNRIEGDNLCVRTKRTFAGDTQSGEKGDISVSVEAQLLASYEVKGVTLDQAGIDRVLGLHGQHDYPLCIVALDFNPLKLRDALNSLENTFGVRLEDFLLTTLVGIVVATKRAPSEVLMAMFEIYNSEFCEQIEGDETLKVYLQE